MPVIRLSAKQALERFRTQNDCDSDRDLEYETTFIDGDNSDSEEKFIVNESDYELSDDEKVNEELSGRESASNLDGKDGTIWTKVNQNQFTRIRHRINGIQQPYQINIQKSILFQFKNYFNLF